MSMLQFILIVGIFNSWIQTPPLVRRLLVLVGGRSRRGNPQDATADKKRAVVGKLNVDCGLVEQPGNLAFEVVGRFGFVDVEVGGEGAERTVLRLLGGDGGRLTVGSGLRLRGGRLLGGVGAGGSGRGSSGDLLLLLGGRGGLEEGGDEGVDLGGMRRGEVRHFDVVEGSGYGKSAEYCRALSEVDIEVVIRER